MIRFGYHQSMDVDDVDAPVAAIAAAIGEPARARMLYCLVDGRARTSTELAVVANVTPSTASVHLQRLKAERLVKVLAQGKHRYYSLERADVAAALEALSVLAGGARDRFVARTPHRLREARTCYDHIAGTLGVALHDAARRLDGCRVSRPVTPPTTSPIAVSRGSRRWGLTSSTRAGSGGALPSHASTGVNAGRISVGRSVRRCSTWH